jgi:hypothetical protein
MLSAVNKCGTTFFSAATHIFGAVDKAASALELQAERLEIISLAQVEADRNSAETNRQLATDRKAMALANSRKELEAEMIRLGLSSS